VSLVTRMFLAEKYGLRLNTEALSEVVGMTPASIRNAINAGTFPIPTYLEMNRRYADHQHVAQYLDECKERASL
jgi:hypothetical protein